MPKPKSINPFALATLKACKGYQPKFVDGKTNVDLDVLNDAQKKLLPVVNGNNDNLLNYTNLSVWYNKKRKVPFVSAYNVDGGLKKDISRNGINFHTDDRISKNYQLHVDKFYAEVTNITEFEIGHMASHNEMAWGDTLYSKVRSYQTFHYTNSVPQVEKLNSGLWSKLESYVIKESKESGSQKINVFTGPMLKDSDPVYLFDKNFQVPLFFFKIVVFLWEGKLYSTGYVMSQYKRALELGLIPAKTKPVLERKELIEVPEPFSDYNHKDVFQVNIELIENYTGLNFEWDKVTRIEVPNGEYKLEEIAETGGTEERLRMKTLAGITEDENSPVFGKVTNMILPSKLV